LTIARCATASSFRAARYHTQVEFDRTYRSIRREAAYRDKNLLFISGLNIDISPRGKLKFPLTKFAPWAAYVRLRDGRNFNLEQDELTETLPPVDRQSCRSTHRSTT
jgi:hypothetical protein